MTKARNDTRTEGVEVMDGAPALEPGMAIFLDFDGTLVHLSLIHI